MTNVLANANGHVYPPAKQRFVRAIASAASAIAFVHVAPQHHMLRLHDTDDVRRFMETTKMRMFVIAVSALLAVASQALVVGTVVTNI
jgi:hypothetical protein